MVHENSVFILFSRFFSLYPLLSLTGSGRRTAFISSLNLSQISEFSMVIAALGLSYGHISPNVMTLIIYTMAFTSIVSSYFIQFNHKIFSGFDFLLNRLGFPAEKSEDKEREIGKIHSIVILGFHRGARAFINEIEEENPKLLKEVLVIDFNSEILREIKSLGVDGIYGDISHIDTLQHANVHKAKIILSTIPNMLLRGTNNEAIVRVCRSINYSATIIATAESTRQEPELLKLGANVVIHPYSLAGKHIFQKLKQIGSF